MFLLFLNCYKTKFVRCHPSILEAGLVKTSTGILLVELSYLIFVYKNVGMKGTVPKSAWTQELISIPIRSILSKLVQKKSRLQWYLLRSHEANVPFPLHINCRGKPRPHLCRGLDNYRFKQDARSFGLWDGRWRSNALERNRWEILKVAIGKARKLWLTSPNRCLNTTELCINHFLQNSTHFDNMQLKLKQVLGWNDALQLPTVAKGLDQQNMKSGDSTTKKSFQITAARQSFYKIYTIFIFTVKLYSQSMLLAVLMPKK